MTLLTELNLNSNYITDLAGLEGATSLLKLDLTSNPRVNPSTPTIPVGTLLQSSLVSLSSLSLLQHLQLNYTGISDVSALSPLTSLIALNMGYNNIVDVNPLASLVNLVHLGLSGNKITGLTNGNVNKLRTLTNAASIILTSNITMSCAELGELQTALNAASVVVQPNVVVSAGTTANCSLP